ncbi:MAG: hypothetical protein GWN59_04675 [Calditrichae bacterium]|nr:hypothetical protein [Calditrichia bacterium]
MKATGMQERIMMTFSGRPSSIFAKPIIYATDVASMGMKINFIKESETHSLK